jgi:hypothetical protein
MRQVLLIGLDPETVDFSNPAIPQGLDSEKIHAGLVVALQRIERRGWHADLCLIKPDGTAGIAVERQLATKTYDCVVIGAGIRLPPQNFLLLEVIINVVHKAAPNASIAFNTMPEDTDDAAARWLKDDQARSAL